VDLDQLTSYDDFRKIIHVDMDAFYASVEQRDDPSLRGKPIAVGGGERRGVTTTASYEARKFGVKSAMPGWKAKELCPEIIFVKPRFEAYRAVSRVIRSIFESYTDNVEPLSFDEAYLDVTQNLRSIRYAQDIAVAIKEDIYTKTGLTASAGVSYCKFLAKIASDYRKPNGITIITPRKAISFIESLDIQKFHGVGKVIADKMKSMGIYTGADLKLQSQEDLTKYFGKSGSYFYNIARGIDERPVVNDRTRKSLAVERTFDEVLNSKEDILLQIEYIAQKLSLSISSSRFYCKTLTLKLKNKDFISKTRSVTLENEAFENYNHILHHAQQLVEANIAVCQNLRLLGLTVSNQIVQSEEYTNFEIKETAYDLFNLKDDF
jgi:DNA polymerase IV